MILQCKICSKKISGKGKTGLCISCVKIGKNCSANTRTKLHAACSGKRNAMYGKIGKKHPMYGRKHTLGARIKQHNMAIGRKHSLETIIKLSGKNSVMYGKHPSNETRLKLKAARIGKTPMLGKHHSSETKRNQRIARINQISRSRFNGNQVQPNYNFVACQKIDEYGKQYRYNFKHAMNGGEYYIKDLGYWVDGYDKERNTVIEYYEKAHNSSVMQDLNRETEICNHLNCDFIILWENM